MPTIPDYNFPLRAGTDGQTANVDDYSFLKKPYPKPDAVDEFFERLRRVADEELAK